MTAAEDLPYTTLGVIAAADPTPSTISIRPIHNRPPLVTIHPDGTLEYGPDYTPDEAARVFWDAMAARAQSMDALYGRGLSESVNEHLAAGGKAEAAIERVQRVCHDLPYEHARRVLAALDGDQPAT